MSQKISSPFHASVILLLLLAESARLAPARILDLQQAEPSRSPSKPNQSWLCLHSCLRFHRDSDCLRPANIF